MKIEKETKASLDAIRDKVMQRDTVLSRDELNHLATVYSDIQKIETGKGRVLDQTCSSCINQAMTVLYNYVTFHEDGAAQAEDVVEQNIQEHIGSIGQGKFDERKARLETAGYIMDEKSTDFVMNERVNDLSFTGTVSVQRISEMNDEEFDQLIVQVLPGEPDASNPIPTISDEVMQERIQQLAEIGFERDGVLFYSDAETGSSIHVDSIQMMTNDGLSAYIAMIMDRKEHLRSREKAEDVLKKDTGTNQFDSTEPTRGHQIADKPTDKKDPTGSGDEDEPKELKYDPQSDQIVIVEKDGSFTPFGEVDVLTFDVLWPLAQKKGFKGAKPKKAVLVDYLTKK